MRDLIEALEILKIYAGDVYAPLHCEHGQLLVTCVNADDVSKQDTDRLRELGFDITEEYGEPMFYSFRFGSS